MYCYIILHVSLVRTLYLFYIYIVNRLAFTFSDIFYCMLMLKAVFLVLIFVSLSFTLYAFALFFNPDDKIMTIVFFFVFSKFYIMKNCLFGFHFYYYQIRKFVIFTFYDFVFSYFYYCTVVVDDK